MRYQTERRGSTIARRCVFLEGQSDLDLIVAFADLLRNGYKSLQSQESGLDLRNIAVDVTALAGRP